MKSAYELAMERLEEQGPTVKLSDEQRARLGEIDEKFKARIAEKEVFLGDLITKAQAVGDLGEVAELERQLARELTRLRDGCETEKEKVRGR